VRVAIPTILVNCVDPNAGLASVAPDEHGAGSEAARVLMEAGHTQIGVVAGPPDTMQDRLRVAGIQAEAAPAHVIVSVQTAPNRDIGAGFDAARTLLSAPGVATALICTHERLAIGARLAAADLGLAIPADMSIVSLDDGEQAGLAAGSADDHHRTPGSGYGRGGRNCDAAASRRGGRGADSALVLQLSGYQPGLGSASATAGPETPPPSR
jgi:DNA-binding LacI/PurR family transcriptional regulator